VGPSEGLVQQGVCGEVDLAARQVVGSPPVGVHLAQLVGRQGVFFGSHNASSFRDRSHPADIAPQARAPSKMSTNAWNRRAISATAASRVVRGVRQPTSGSQKSVRPTANPMKTRMPAPDVNQPRTLAPLP